MIAHNRPTVGVEEAKAANRVLSSGWLAQGKEVENFENKFCQFLGLNIGHAVAVSSGSSALYLALWALKAKDKNVAYPSYVCSALRNAVSLAGANHEIIDIEKDSPNIDINLLNNLNPEISIIPHMFGNPVDINKINTKYIIEDCCQSLGAKYNNINTGISSDLGIFSFYATKLITSGGQGGMVVSKDKSIINEIKDYRDFDMQNDKKNRFNFQMTDLQAAIGAEQLKKLPYFLERRLEIFSKYLDTKLNFQICKTNNGNPINYRAILLDRNPKKLIKKLFNNNINAIVPIEEWELLKKTPNALSYSNRTVSLPIYPSLSNKELNHIINIIK
ncbi:DegT/DnrJ/EryC1/StrS family aminotransferase [Flavobacteriaceae bacterium]|nr:DegT/DnrJ/EryC1/StrS family aminotransferase [Flavobacteriaceae bacterium]